MTFPLLQDLQQGLRQVQKNPGPSTVIFFTLALAIGTNITMFGIVNGVILSPLPYPAADRLVSLNETSTASGGKWAFSYPNYLDCRRSIHTLKEIAAWRNEVAPLTAPGTPRYITIQQVSANFLPTLGVNLDRGRNFQPEEDHPGAGGVALISRNFLRNNLQDDLNAIGSVLRLSGKAYTVIGVLPDNFSFFKETQILVPLGQSTDRRIQSRDFHPGIKVIGRLADGKSIDETRVECSNLARQLEQMYPGSNRDRSFEAVPLKTEIVGNVQATLFLLTAAVLCVLLIACVNVANLLLSRSASRANETAVRLALGATRRRLTTQAIVETIPLSLLSGAAGLALAYFGLNAVGRSFRDLPRIQNIRIDPTVMLFAVGASLLTALFCSILPAVWQGTEASHAFIRQSNRVTGGPLRWVQNGLVVTEVAVAIVLLFGTGLMVSTIRLLWSTDIGFNPDHSVVATFGLAPDAAKGPELTRAKWRDILERVKLLQGVTAAALNTLVPLSGNDSQIDFTVRDDTGAARSGSATIYTPTPEYVRAMGMAIIRGRFFTDLDHKGAESVAVVDELFAQREFVGKEALGQTVNLQFLGNVKVVGIVAHVKQNSLDEGSVTKPREQIYVPIAQIPDPFVMLAANNINLTVRSETNPNKLVLDVERTMESDSAVLMRNISTIDDVLADSLGRRKTLSTLLTVFSALALVLAAMGMYGVISYTVGQRVREVAIRVAVGASPEGIIGMIVKDGLRLACFAALIGMIVAAVTGRLLKSFLYGVGPYDLTVLSVVLATVLATALIASAAPAIRAARLDPARSLNSER